MVQAIVRLPWSKDVGPELRGEDDGLKDGQLQQLGIVMTHRINIACAGSYNDFSRDSWHMQLIEASAPNSAAGRVRST